MFFENMINHSIESLQQFAKMGHLTFQLAPKHTLEDTRQKII